MKLLIFSFAFIALVPLVAYAIPATLGNGANPPTTGTNGTGVVFLDHREKRTGYGAVYFFPYNWTQPKDVDQTYKAAPSTYPLSPVQLMDIAACVDKRHQPESQQPQLCTLLATNETTNLEVFSEFAKMRIVTQEAIQNATEDDAFAADCFLYRSANVPLSTHCKALSLPPADPSNEREVRRHQVYIAKLEDTCKVGAVNEETALCLGYLREKLANMKKLLQEAVEKYESKPCTCNLN